MINNSKKNHLDKNKNLDFEKIINKILLFNKKIQKQNNLEKKLFPQDKKDIIELFQFRSKMFENLGFNKEFPDPITGFSYDNYDKNSLLFIKKNQKNQLCGSTRMILDTKEKKLPADKLFNLDKIREKYGKKNLKIAECSRILISKQKKEGGEFLYFGGKFNEIAKKLNIGYLICSVSENHFQKYYSQFYHFQKLKELNSGYGKIKQKSVIIGCKTDGFKSLYFKTKKF